MLKIREHSDGVLFNEETEDANRGKLQREVFQLPCPATDTKWRVIISKFPYMNLVSRGSERRGRGPPNIRSIENKSK